MTEAQSRAVRFERPYMRFPVDQIGGGRVMRAFTMGGERIKAGTVLSAEIIASFPPNNRRELLDHFIAVWPKAPDVAGNASSAVGVGADRTERHVVALGFGRYDVIDGVKLNDKALSRSDAYALAGKPEPERKTS